MHTKHQSTPFFLCWCAYHTILPHNLPFSRFQTANTSQDALIQQMTIGKQDADIGLHATTVCARYEIYIIIL